MNRCCYCDAEFPNERLRPYGPGGADACYACATTPERMAFTQAVIRAHADHFLRFGGVVDERGIVPNVPPPSQRGGDA